ncbi:MAG: hypothetical protein QUT30_00355 [Acidobacteriota bacterium]|nr:hypothetical protein [Acidobacteriota bacterium]
MKRGFSGLAGNGQVSLVGAQNAMRNAQAKAETWYLMPHGGASEESFKDVRPLRFRYPFAMIRDLHVNRAAGSMYEDFQRRPGGRIFCCVINQLLDCQLDEPPV